MKVILLKDIKKLGKVGDVVEVTDGYARNYLIPRSLAEQSTAGKLKNLKEIEKAEQRKAEQQNKEAEKLAEKLNGVEITINAKAGEEEKLFGSITSNDIAEEILNSLGINIDKKDIELDTPIKSLGTHTIDINLYSGIKPQVKVCVVPE